MAWLRIRDFGKKGWHPDKAPHDATHEEPMILRNMQFRDMALRTSPGYFQALSFPGYQVRQIGLYPHSTIPFMLIAATNGPFTHSKIYHYRFDGVGPTDYSKPGNHTASRYWQFAHIGWGMLANNVTEVPHGGATGVTVMTALPNWPSTWRTLNIKEFSSTLVAVNMVEGSNSYPQRVRWSDYFNPNDDIPDDWDETDPASASGFYDLHSRLGILADQAPLSDRNILYHSNGVSAMAHVGPPNYFSFRTIFSDDGIHNAFAWADLGDKHLVVGWNGIYLHDGYRKQDISTGRVRRWLQWKLNSDRSIFCIANWPYQEVFVFYGNRDKYNDAASVYANEALVYNVLHDAWTLRDVPQWTTCAALMPEIIF